MLRVDAAKLRWLGVDMRPRWRRRVAVVLTYAAFVVAVWWHPRRSFEVIWLVFMLLGFLPQLSSAISEGLHVWPKRIAVGVLLAGTVWIYWRHPRPSNSITNDMYAFVIVMGWSVLGWGKLVESVWWRNRWTRRLMGRSKHLQSLEDFAQHYFGESFGELSAEQQMEVGRLYRATPMGEWVKPGSGRFPATEDERLRHEDDRLRAEVQRWMVWILWFSAVGWSIAAMVHGSIRAGTVEAWGWTMAMLSVTLRQAIVLWSEEDPRVTSSEMELVEQEV
jgi:hypothetical protein